MSFARLAGIAGFVAGAALCGFGTHLYDGARLARAEAKHARFVAEARTRALLAANAARDAQRAADEVMLQAARASVASQNIILNRTAQTLERVAAHVSDRADRLYRLSNGFVRLYDASITGRDPEDVAGPAGQPDDAASTVALSAAADVILRNNGECLLDRDRLVKLQDAWEAALTTQAQRPPPVIKP